MNRIKEVEEKNSRFVLEPSEKSLNCRMAYVYTYDGNDVVNRSLEVDDYRHKKTYFYTFENPSDNRQSMYLDWN